jgi:hypothetical protein
LQALHKFTGAESRYPVHDQEALAPSMAFEESFVLLDIDSNHKTMGALAH